MYVHVATGCNGIDIYNYANPVNVIMAIHVDMYSLFFDIYLFAISI